MQQRQFVGDMVGTAKIVGDILSPAVDLTEIEVYCDYSDSCGSAAVPSVNSNSEEHKPR